jgi:phosphonoacetaldehyde hydrolase
MKGVIVDWAGTIVDYGSRAPVEAFRAAFAHEGVPITVAEARGPMGLAKRDHISAVIEMPRVAGAWRERHGAPAGDADIERIYRRFLPLQLPVLTELSTVIPGALDAFAAFRARGLKIGSTTGYVRELMDVLLPHAEKQGLHVDSLVCPSDVAVGRPAPYMCFLNAMRMNVHPMWELVKIGDTPADVDEGRNAGMWTIGVTRQGNEVGLSPEEQAALPPAELRARIGAARERLAKADYLVESIAETPAVLDLIEQRIVAGERPR